MKRLSQYRVILGLFAWVLLFAAMAMSQGCATIGATGPDAAGTTGTPWYMDIQSWTPYQKANFFNDTWQAEKANYDAANAIPNKSEALKRMLETKQQILEVSRVPIRTYATSVKAGGAPDPAVEMQIITWLRQLQAQALQQMP
jgi:hypothetical protein